MYSQRLLLTCALAIPMIASAQTAVTIDVATPGTLPELIGEEQKMQIQSLTITGDINGKDIAFIRDMGKGVMDYSTWQWNSSLLILDLSGANIITADEPYTTSYPYPTTEQGVIGEDMFTKFASLIELKLPNSATRICKRSIDSNSKLAELTLPDSLKTIEKWGIYYDTSLVDIIIPENVELIQEAAFYGCGIEKVKIDSSDLILEPGAFAGLSMLTDIEANEDNKSFSSVEGVLFSKDLSTLLLYPGGRRDESYSVKEGITTIGNYAFYGNTNITDVNLPESLTSIGDYAFDGCTQLKPILFPANLTSIGDYAFTGCNQMITVDLSKTSVKTIGNNAWSGVAYLNEINLSPVLESVGESAFPSGQYTTLDLPPTLKTIGAKAFAVMSLENVYAQGNEPAECDGDVFGIELKTSLGMEVNATLHVPVGYVDVYSQADGFKYFYNIVGDIENVGVELTPAESPMGESIFYDLSGRKIDNPSGGIFIEITPDGKVCKIAK